MTHVYFFSLEKGNAAYGKIDFTFLNSYFIKVYIACNYKVTNTNMEF